VMTDQLKSSNEKYLCTLWPTRYPPPTKWITSILSSSLIIVQGHSLRRTTRRFCSTAIRWLGNENNSRSPSKFVPSGTSLDSPFNNMRIKSPPRLIFSQAGRLIQTGNLAMGDSTPQLDLFTLADRSYQNAGATIIKARKLQGDI